MKIPESELIINQDGSIYHLNLKPGELAETIITVGDPDRVDQVAAYLDSIELTRVKREFKTITGFLKEKRLSIISTGIGTDNIDIVFNEIDALFNIDFVSREVKESRTTLSFIRIGTSGCLKNEIALDSFLISEKAIGTDGLLNFYETSNAFENMEISLDGITPYLTKVDPSLFKHFKDASTISGVTVTANGFYGPQNRSIRLKPKADWLQKLMNYSDGEITNLEMETAGIYAMAQLLGHRAISLNVLLANRKLGSFSENPAKATKALIEWTLEKIMTL